MRIPKYGHSVSNAKYYRKKRGTRCPHCKETRAVRLIRIHAECYECESCGAVFDKDTSNYYFPKENNCKNQPDDI